jgi:ABC-type branched-subunit amino acid transport system ATPase component
VLLIEQKLTIAMPSPTALLVMGHGSIVFEGTAAACHSWRPGGP